MQKHHTLKTDNRGVPILSKPHSGISNRVQKRQFVVNQAQRSRQRGQRGHREEKQKYHVMPELQDNMVGQWVTDPSQLKATTIEALKRGKRCYRCFQPWTPDHSGQLSRSRHAATNEGKHTVPFNFE